MNNLPESLAALDWFIGEPDYLQKGIGSKALLKALAQFAAPQYTHALVDPDINNIAVIKAYQKAGFKITKAITSQHEVWMLKTLDIKKYPSHADWALKILNEDAYNITADKPLTIRNMPWSQVDVISTKQGSVFLKSMAKPFSKEALLINYLSRHITHPKVPKIIAFNQPLQCFLMQNAGAPLRNLLKTTFDAHLAKRALKYCAELQIAAIPHINSLLALGLPDWRLSVLPKHYKELIQNPALLQQDGLSANEIKQLQQLYDPFKNLCQSLSDLSILETLEHGDFHDNNILIENRSLTINDWADASITHPFFSCVSWFESACRHHHLNTNHSSYNKLLQVYLKPWLAFHNEEKLRQALKMAWKIRPIIFVLNFRRINQCSGIESYPEYQGYIKEALQKFIELH